MNTAARKKNDNSNNPILLSFVAFGLFAILICLSSPPSFAQLHQCDGKWTNKECEGEIANSITAAPSKKESPEEDPRAKALKEHQAKKMSMVYGLLRTSREAQREHGVSSPRVREAERLCANESSSFSQCQNSVNAANAHLAELTAAKKAEQSEDDLGHELKKLDELGKNKPKK
ncbi:hypothetical protein BVY02_00250 [bacterium J17]|nr:hypothetical protein BVY02_00250 [bacterium J17]